MVDISTSGKPAYVYQALEEWIKPYVRQPANNIWLEKIEIFAFATCGEYFKQFSDSREYHGNQIDKQLEKFLAHLWMASLPGEHNQLHHDSYDAFPVSL